MSAAVTVIIQLLVNILPLITTSENVARIVEALIKIIPVAAKLAQDLVTPIKAIIEALKNNPEATEDQLRQLEDLSARVDAEFEAAAALAIAEDAAVESPPEK